MDGMQMKAAGAPRRRFPAVWVIGWLGVLAACGGGLSDPFGGGALEISDPTAQVATSEHGMVSSAAVWATEVGATVLAEGGNAVDAAVATGFALAVTEPSMSGIAGRASIVIRTPGGQIHGIDGLNEVPAGFQSGGPAGYDRAATPGTIAALARALDEHGSWSLDQVLAPAIELAEEGFVLPEAEAGRFASAAGDLAQHPSSAAVFLRPDGTPWREGDLFRQPDLARTLRAVAEEGVEVFYTGWIADSIHADMQRHGGFITRDDLAGYEARTAIGVEGTYRGHRVVSNFRPASGHSVIQALQTLEEVSGSAEMIAADDLTWAILIGQAMHWALQDRGRREGGEEASAAFLTSRAHAQARAQQIVVPEAEPVSGARRPSGRIERVASAAWEPGVLVGDPSDREATTHLSAADADGMVVSITQSLGPSLGTRLVAPGLGFLYATRLGSQPGSRPSSTISPTIVLDGAGAPVLALGGAGDARIISAVIQVVSRHLDQGLPLAEAMAASRVHPTGAQTLRMEEGSGGWSSQQRADVAALGFDVDTSPPGYFGRVHAVQPTPEGILGVAEPRWAGSAAGPVGR